MSTYKEKLGLLSQMISFARIDQGIQESEYDFIFNVAQNLGVTKKAFDQLLHNTEETIIPERLSARLIQFHRLLLLMNIDQRQHLSEIKKLHEIGLKMGLPPSAIDEVLCVMLEYPKNAIPPKRLIEIFKNHFN